jgi:hypothetical protein
MISPIRKKAANVNQGTTALPHQDTTALPHQGTTALPHQGTTALPHQGTTALPHQDTTALPHQGTTALRHQGTTALPHQDTTALPYLGELLELSYVLGLLCNPVHRVAEGQFPVTLCQSSISHKKTRINQHPVRLNTSHVKPLLTGIRVMKSILRIKIQRATRQANTIARVAHYAA